MGAIASQSTSFTINYPIDYSDGEFLAQIASYAKNLSIWWRQYDEKHFHCVIGSFTSWSSVYANQFIGLGMLLCLHRYTTGDAIQTDLSN